MSFASELTNTHGSPLYTYDLNEITESYVQLKKVLPEEAIIFYSLKANANKFVVEHLINLGCYAEVTSKGEVETALRAGADPQKILYTGPGKTKNEIAFALSKDITFFSVESFSEINRLKEINMKYEKSIKVILRINPSSSENNASLKMSGVPSQFGIEEEEILKNKNIIESEKLISIVGFHIYNGSNYPDDEKILKNFELVLQTIQNIMNIVQIDLKFIDFGGGFASPYAKNDKKVTYNSLKLQLIDLLNKYLDEKFKNTKIAFESGRYLVGSSGTIIGTVQNKKVSKGKNFCVLDFGINHLGGMSGIGRITSKNIDMMFDTKKYSHNDPLIETTVVGPLCTPLDYVAKKVLLPSSIEIDHTIWVPNVGAYGLSASLVAFLGHEFPLELIIKDGKVVNKSRLKIDVGSD